MKYEFVEHIPAELLEEVIYISTSFGTIVHKCCCGCGNEVVTPLSPTDWKVTFDGESVTLYPSIGNWSLKCKSHYWIKKNNVVWAERWSKNDIDFVKREQHSEKVKYFKDKEGSRVKKKKWSLIKYFLDKLSAFQSL